MNRLAIAAAAGLVLASTATAALIYSGDPTAPLPPVSSSEVRAEFEACRAKATETARFLCECEVLDRQCESPRHPTHGAWRTMEFWPSDDIAEREVFLFLAPRVDDLEQLNSPEQGLMIHCKAGNQTLTALLGDNVDVFSPASLVSAGETHTLTLVEAPEGLIGEPEFPDTAIAELQQSGAAQLDYQNEWGEPRTLEFAAQGLAAAKADWDAECGG